ncbi:MAG TPA: hypothetical protein VIU02_11995, partial [Burkholderiales bacterium]
YAFMILLMRGGNILTVLRRGFITWAVVHASLGLLDLGGKLVGLPDLLSPVRSANYVLLVEVEEAGFWRIAGGFSEASAFGSVSLACLGFAYTYWRVSGSRPMLALTVVLFLLLLLSTSSTAYAGLAFIVPFTAIPIVISILRGRLATQHIWLLLFGWLGLLAAVGIYLVNESVYDPVIRLFESTVLNKSMSASAVERTYWNSRSIDAFLATGGLGIGLGSSRSSSWVIAVISQLGVIGALAVASLVGVLLKDLVSPRRDGVSRETLALVSGARSCVLASLAGASVASGFADPGLLFFISLAIVVMHRKSAVHAAEFRGLAAVGAR